MSGALFLAIAPDDQTRSLLAQMLAPFGERDRLPGRLSPPENWHITVRFLGTIDEVTTDRLVAELDQASWPGPFTVGLSGFGAFPRPEKATVLWVGVKSEPLLELWANVDDLVANVGLPAEDRPYVPHLTLSRVRPPEDLSALTADDWGRLRFGADELVLFRSLPAAGGIEPQSSNHGRVRYDVVERFPLG